MSSKSPLFCHPIRLLGKSVPRKAYQQIVRLSFIALLALVTTLSVPALSAQPIEGISQGISQSSNAKLLLQQGIELYEAGQFSQAIEVWQQAISAFITQGDSLNHALVLRYLSLAYQHLGQWQEAEGAIAIGRYPFR